MSISGVWMWPQSVSAFGADRAAELCALSGITDVFFLTKGLAGTASYRSALSPCASERDLLAELLHAAHARGIRVHAWLTSASDEHYKSRFAQSGRCHYTRGRDRGLISLADQQYLAYMQQVVREICSGYEIDGLHLDYIRYNHLLYGWAEDDLARYAAAGADISRLRQLMDETFFSENEAQKNTIFDAYRAGDKDAHALATARRSDVRHFASMLIAGARDARSDLVISAALMPEGAYDDIAFSDLHYGQNYEDAAGLYDMVLPMAYSKAYEKGPQWVRTVADGSIKKGLSTVVGLHAYEGGTGPSLTADISALSGSAAKGICLFRFGAFAIALAQGAYLRIINTLDKPITAAITADGQSLLSPGKVILPGEEADFTAPFSAALRVFCGDEEACVYTVY